MEGSALLKGLMGTNDPAPRGSGRTTRRSLLRYGALAAGAGVGSSLLSACGTKAGPAVAQNQTVVVWNPICSYWALDAKTAIPLVEHAMGPFLAKNRGLKLKSAGPMINTSTTTSAILAGTAPDVFPDNNIAPYVEGSLTADLTPLMRKDNVSTNLFATSQMAKFTQSGKIYALPAYVGTTVMLVNQAVLDAQGLKYPNPSWTYKEWTTLFASVTKTKGSQKRHGTSIFGGPLTSFYYHGFGASIVDPTDPSKCVIDSPKAITAARWILDLLDSGYAINNGGGQINTQKLFAQGLSVAPVMWIQMLPHWVPILQGMNWNIYQMPRWPVQPATFANSDFWAIPSNTKVRDAAWMLLREITTGTAYQTIMMKAALFPPALKSLWQQWVAQVQAVAPPLRGKNLTAFSEYVLSNHAFPGQDFKYSTQQAFSTLGSVMSQIQGRSVSLTTGLKTAAQQVNALETAARRKNAPISKNLINQFPHPASSATATASTAAKAKTKG